MSAVHTFRDGRVVLHHGDCLSELDRLADNSIDSVVCDPPYHLTSIVKRFGAGNAAPAKVGATGAYARASSGFMGKQWDGGDIAFRVELWAKVWRVLKPGGHLVAFSGTRTYHRMAVAIEDAGFEVRDMLSWLYGSGFPKSHNLAVALDKINGVGARSKSFNMKGGGERDAGFTQNGREFLPPYEASTDAAREWQGWGTALKPACEPICFARKPLSEGTIAANVLAHGTGAINVDACRIEAQDGYTENNVTQGINTAQTSYEPRRERRTFAPSLSGRWPANVLHDGSDEVVGAFPETHSAGAARPNTPGGTYDGSTGIGFGGIGVGQKGFRVGDAGGSAARFFYSAKADANDRMGSKHPTVKPVDLMRWLVRLVTPKGGLVLDPFAGTGTTGAAAFLEGFNAILIEREAEYVADITRRMDLLLAGPDEKAHTLTTPESVDALPLFGGAA